MLKRIEEALASIPYPATPEGLYEPISYTMSLGGKRLRPALTLYAYSLYRSDVETAMPVALAIELYHNHTLLHDDVMDQADVRRGRPTVHRKWDGNTAILSGDTMLIMAVRQLLQLPPSVSLPPVLELLTRTMQEICEGQQMDMNFERQENVREEDYLEMIRKKTSVLLACALRAGAMVAGAPEEDAEMLYRFGESLGLAFQLQDDYLDCYGNPEVFGKETGGDIRCGKKTYLLINALQRADAVQRSALQSRAVPEVLEVYRQLDIPRRCLERIEALFDEARTLYEALPVPAERKRPLWELAEQMLHRQK